MSRTSVHTPQLPQWIVIGFTGHRRLATPEAIAQSIRAAIDRIAATHPLVAGISSAASGADTLFVEELARRNAPFSLILPFPVARFQQDFADDAPAWQRVQTLFPHAMHVEIIPQNNPRADAPADNAADNIAYMDAGYRTVDRCDVLLAVWDGKPARGFGGTGDTVAYARALVRPIIIIDSETGQLTEERVNLLHPPAAASAPPAAPRQTVEAYFAALNTEAQQYGPRARVIVRICLQLYMIASILGAAGLIFHVERAVGITFTLISAAITIITSILMLFFTRTHARWLQSRVEAEVCRSALATWDIHRLASVWEHGTLERPPVLGLESLSRRLALLRDMDRTATPSLEQARAAYNKDRLEQQIAYFRHEHRTAQSSLSRRKLAMKIFGILTLLFSLFLIAWTIFGLEANPLVHWIHFLAIAFPLATSAIGITLITQESVRRAALYAEMAHALEAIHRRLLASNSADALARAAAEAEALLLQELIEWRSFIRFTKDVAHPG